MSLAYAIDTPGSDGDLDRSGRVITSQWTLDIEAVILRDVDLSTAWNAQADALDTRHYYCQNWRADVSVIIDDSAVLVERVMYSPYGVPFGIPVGDLVSSGGAEPADGGVRGADSTALTGTYWGSSYNIADLDNDGDVDSADQTIQSNNNGATIGWTFLSDTHNRLGYAGYVFDEALTGTKWHVRHRVLESVLGRWISRDPLGYVDGISLYEGVRSQPGRFRDPSGTTCQVTPEVGCEYPRRCGYYYVAECEVTTIYSIDSSCGYVEFLWVEMIKASVCEHCGFIRTKWVPGGPKKHWLLECVGTPAMEQTSYKCDCDADDNSHPWEQDEAICAKYFIPPGTHCILEYTVLLRLERKDHFGPCIIVPR